VRQPYPRPGDRLIGRARARVSGLVPVGQGWVPLGGEGGHVTLPATEEREFAVLKRLHRDHRHVSAERVLSGPGLELLLSDAVRARRPEWRGR